MGPYTKTMGFVHGLFLLVDLDNMRWYEASIDITNSYIRDGLVVFVKRLKFGGVKFESWFCFFL